MGLGDALNRIGKRAIIALREPSIGMGGPGNGYPRQDGFDIVVASEVMAILYLATSLADLKHRVGNIVVGYTGGSQAGTGNGSEGDPLRRGRLRQPGHGHDVAADDHDRRA